MMPGGSVAAWPLVKDIFQAICAKTPDGEPCCDWVGEDGAGHYVKMVHNGIEYGDMQLICEAYQLMKEGLGLSNEEMHDVFAEWNKGELDSYLIEITRDILAYKDEDGEHVVDKILDTAGQKGTGKWTSVSSLDLGMPVTLIGEAVYARCLSAMKDERVAASQDSDRARSSSSTATGRRSSKTSGRRCWPRRSSRYAQGFMLLREAAKEYKWNLNYGGIALMWRGGCIIRSAFLGKIKEAFDRESEPQQPAARSRISQDVIERCQPSWRRVVAKAVEAGVPVPAFTTALAFYDGYRSERLPANLLQAQRDYFGAHTYERVDQPRGKFFHTNWTGKGGNVSAGTYTV